MERMAPTLSAEFDQGNPLQDKLFEASALHNVAVGKWQLDCQDGRRGIET